MKIGFLPFYVNYYEASCPGLPAQKAAVARRCAATLVEHGEVLWDGALIGDTSAAAAAGMTLARQTPDCIVVLTTIAVFGSIPWAALEHLDAPLLLWNAQQIETVDDDYSMVEIVRNTGQIGIQALANTLLRHGRAFRVVTGYEGSTQTRQKLERYFRIIGAVKAVRTAKLLAIGGGFPGMTDIEIDEAALAVHIGATVSHIDAAALTAAYCEVPVRRVECALDELRARATLRDLTDDEAARSVRLSEALKTLTAAHGAAGGTLNCHGANCLRNDAIGITACFALGEQNALGRPFTCTGDLPTAVAMLLLQHLTGSAMYTEVQVMDERRGAIVLANSGEGETGLARDSASTSIRGNANFSGVHGRGASFSYPLKAGPATVVSFTPTPRGPKNYRLVVAEGEILEETLPDVGALAGFFRFAHHDLFHGYKRWLESGPVHHAATAPGHWSEELAAAAAMLDLEFVAI